MPLRTLDFPYQAKLPYPFLLKTANRPVIFIHIPKTGGTSINRALKLPPPDKSKQIAKHYTLAVIKKHLPPNIWAEAYKFAFVRNPYERLFSHYQYRLKHGRVLHNHGQQLSFTEWVKQVLPATEPNNLQAQHLWISTQEEQIEVDFVGKFEQLTADFQQICSDLNIPKVKLPHLNKSTQQGQYLDAFDEKSKAIAAAYYEKDLQLFNYSFNG